MASAMREVWKAKDMGAMRDISMWMRSGYCVMSWYGTTLESYSKESGLKRAYFFIQSCRKGAFGLDSMTPLFSRLGAEVS